MGFEMELPGPGPHTGGGGEVASVAVRAPP